MDSTDPDKFSLTPPNRIKIVTITIVVWVILAWTLFVFVPNIRTIYEGFEIEPHLISRLYIWVNVSAYNRVFPNTVNAAMFCLAGISVQVVLIELFIPRHGKMTALPRLQSVVMWLLILLPLWVALIGVSAMGLDLYILKRELS